MTDPLMNEHHSEQVRRWLAARDKAMPPPETDHIVHETLSRLPTTPQARARLLGRWFDRGGGARRRTTDHDHPPRSGRRAGFMYSALTITTAIAITAVALNVIDTTPDQPSAGTASTHVVAADGSGHYRSIAEAVAAAAEGDTVLVRPGSYVEAIIVDKDITLAGDGPREDVVIRPLEDGPTTAYEAVGVYRFEPAYILLVEDSGAEVRGLTFAGAEAGVVVEAGSPTLTDLYFDENEFGLLIHSGSTATFTDSLLAVGGIESSGSQPVISKNVLRDGAGIFSPYGMAAGSVIKDNTLIDGRIEVGGSPLIVGNTVTGAGSVAIASLNPEGPGGAPVIRDNIIRDSHSGIQVGSGGLSGEAAGGNSAVAGVPEVSGNDISVELNAITANWTDAMISENTIEGSWNGIVLFGSGSAEITGNEIDVESVGIDIGKDTSPSVDGNSICGGEASIKVHETATPSMGENTLCDPA